MKLICNVFYLREIKHVCFYFFYVMHSVVCHTKDIKWGSLHKNSSERDK